MSIIIHRSAHAQASRLQSMHRARAFLNPHCPLPPQQPAPGTVTSLASLSISSPCK